jgi:hypothetical protein
MNNMESRVQSITQHCNVLQTKLTQVEDNAKNAIDKLQQSEPSHHNIWYLQGKNANESPPPQDLPARAATLLGKVIRFYAGHYAPESQGEKSYTDPSTGGPTCVTNEIIYDTIYASPPDDCKLTFA